MCFIRAALIVPTTTYKMQAGFAFIMLTEAVRSVMQKRPMPSYEKYNFVYCRFLYFSELEHRSASDLSRSVEYMVFHLFPQQSQNLD